MLNEEKIPELLCWWTCTSARRIGAPFCIPHKGDSSDLEPIEWRIVLLLFCPIIHHFINPNEYAQPVGIIDVTPWGFITILPISWAYIKTMGGKSLKQTKEIATLNVNCIAKWLEKHYRVFFKGSRGHASLEFILDTRPFKTSANVKAVDVAKRLQYHSTVTS